MVARLGENRGMAIVSRPPAPNQKYVVRLFDMFDGWMDISDELTKEEAQAIWDEKTGHGTHHTNYNDGDYYAIYPADTRMIMTPEFLGR